MASNMPTRWLSIFATSVPFPWMFTPYLNVNIRVMRNMIIDCRKTLCSQCLLGPSNVTVSSESSSSLLVTFTPAAHAASVSLYKASAGGYSCEVAANASPLSCTIEGLSSSTPYTVQGVACLPNGDCSSPNYGQGFTLPDCALILFFINDADRNVYMCIYGVSLNIDVCSLS